MIGTPSKGDCLVSDLLLDTCAVLWLAQGAEMTPASRSAIASRPLSVSPISAWEIANLVRKGRIAATLPVANWFHQAIGKMAARMPPLSVEILTGSCSLPGSPPEDPADRIIIATAREADLTVVTRDRKILDYSRAGHVRTLAC
ncbi:type II toxin-antitoxin system VapC family toxin [Rhodopseudomonas sp. BR0M22]|nr:type II toxin-antitoxin system VapC family toxin [Rhodopseudomonas sp. BR0M22]NEW90928.1 type II toxin-antitoxin system VapC family toxin [Rhodopseudomonas sp. BR0M22]